MCIRDRGYTYIVDRLKDMIITNGYKVYPRNVEEAVYKHPNVEECIVAGLPDKQRGESHLHAGDRRVAEPAVGVAPVSYTHLDVYKRQVTCRLKSTENGYGSVSDMTI